MKKKKKEKEKKGIYKSKNIQLKRFSILSLGGSNITCCVKDQERRGLLYWWWQKSLHHYYLNYWKSMMNDELADLVFLDNFHEDICLPKLLVIVVLKY